jgi:mRNA-degrading endonuclease RelE of RelBE toxin-antitoxin system
MTTPQLLQDITSLPPEAQKQVSDFVAFLKERYGAVARKKVKRGKLEDEPFVGMWKDREDMMDSVKWVRDLRRQEWGQK